jgi:hypothetical protein
MNAFEREEQLLEDDYNAGNLSLAEYNREMRELQRDYRAAAEESARDAYESELQRW